jgi:hypothetical protein
VHICKEVADGNDYKDYLIDEDDMPNQRWKTSTSAWIIVVIIVSVIMCVICGMSCFYNYRVFKTGDEPFPVPSFCPDCLFPRID